MNFTMPRFIDQYTQIVYNNPLNYSQEESSINNMVFFVEGVAKDNAPYKLPGVSKYTSRGASTPDTEKTFLSLSKLSEYPKNLSIIEIATQAHIYLAKLTGSLTD